MSTLSNVKSLFPLRESNDFLGNYISERKRNQLETGTQLNDQKMPSNSIFEDLFSSEKKAHVILKMQRVLY